LVVYAGTTSGLLYKLDYHRNYIIGIFKIHKESVTAITTTESYCITGSEDKTIKIWPLDIS